MRIQHDAERACYYVEPGDLLPAVESASGLVLDPEHDDFLLCEWVADHGDAYEAYWVFTDEGNGLSLFVPKGEGIDTRLLDFCRQFVSPIPTA